MKKILLIPAFALVMASLAASPTVAGAPRFEVVSTTMTGAEEVPVAVDTRARGHAYFLIDHQRETIRYVALAAVVDGVTEAHVHLAPAGQNGAPVVFLFDVDDIPLNIGTTMEGTRRGFVETGIITDDDFLSDTLTFDAFVDQLTSGGAYVNVHTLDFRGGEIRGQIG